MQNQMPTDAEIDQFLLSNINQFKLERLKYIHEQQKFLNENSHKYLTVFQSALTAIVVAGVGVFMSWKKLSISPFVAQTSIRALEWLLVSTGAFVFLVIFTTIASWWDYRREEADLLNDVLEYEFRKSPSFASCWRWFETWLILLVVCLVTGFITYIERWILPLIR